MAFVLAFSSFNSSCWETRTDSASPEVVQAHSSPEHPSGSHEILLSETENAYNPIPNLDGTLIAYVRTGWGRPDGSGGSGRSNLVSDIAVMDANGNVLTTEPLADAFLQGWSSDGGNLICYREFKHYILTPKGKVVLTGLLPGQSDSLSRSERVAFLSKTKSVLWLQNDLKIVKRTETSPGAYMTETDLVRSAIESNKGEFARFDSRVDLDSSLVPSPDERYIALVGRKRLQVCDIQRKTWTDFGEIVLHPSDDWDYIKPSWNPWFSDNSRLVFQNTSGIVVSSPDGKSKQTIFKSNLPSGLVTASPNGKYVAFATFQPRPMKVREDLKFWGGSQIWIVPIDNRSAASPVTQPSQDTTVGLRWLNDNAIVFDRMDEEQPNTKARLWKVELSR